MVDENSKFLVYNRAHKKSTTQISLKLTSMIDMFTILLVFLLHNFSAEGQIVTISQDLTLPESTAEKPPQAASAITITNEWILLDGKRIITVARVLSNSEVMISELASALKDLRAISERVGELSNELGFTGKISIEADKETPYHVLKKVMFSCGQIGYNDMLLAVTKIE